VTQNALFMYFLFVVFQYKYTFFKKNDKKGLLLSFLCYNVKCTG